MKLTSPVPTSTCRLSTTLYAGNVLDARSSSSRTSSLVLGPATGSLDRSPPFRLASRFLSVATSCSSSAMRL